MAKGKHYWGKSYPVVTLKRARVPTAFGGRVAAVE